MILNDNGEGIIRYLEKEYEEEESNVGEAVETCTHGQAKESKEDEDSSSGIIRLKNSKPFIHTLTLCHFHRLSFPSWLFSFKLTLFYAVFFFISFGYSFLLPQILKPNPPAARAAQMFRREVKTLSLRFLDSSLRAKSL